MLALAGVGHREALIISRISRDRFVYQMLSHHGSNQSGGIYPIGLISSLKEWNVIGQCQILASILHQIRPPDQ